MKYFFPMFSVFICLTSNAGFALYWWCTNIMASASSVSDSRYYDAKDAKELANKARCFRLMRSHGQQAVLLKRPSQQAYRS